MMYQNYDVATPVTQTVNHPTLPFCPLPFFPFFCLSRARKCVARVNRRVFLQLSKATSLSQPFQFAFAPNIPLCVPRFPFCPDFVSPRLRSQPKVSPEPPLSASISTFFTISLLLLYHLHHVTSYMCHVSHNRKVISLLLHATSKCSPYFLLHTTTCSPTFFPICYSRLPLLHRTPITIKSHPRPLVPHHPSLFPILIHYYKPFHFTSHRSFSFSVLSWNRSNIFSVS